MAAIVSAKVKAKAVLALFKPAPVIVDEVSIFPCIEYLVYIYFNKETAEYQ